MPIWTAATLARTEPEWPCGLAEAARRAGVQENTLRQYRTRGWIPNKRGRTGGPQGGGEKLWTQADIARIRAVKHARLMELPPGHPGRVKYEQALREEGT